jgi:predicted nucleotidyltransferase
MSYNISSDNFSNPLLKELLKKLIYYFTSIGSEFYIIGATARDIILSGIHNKEPGRKTDDLDIAIAVPDWNKYEEISVGLCKISGIKKSTGQKQRFIFQEAYLLDIVPFGEIAKADNNIYWPPEETHAMSVIGFTAIARHVLEITVDNEFTIYVASLPAIFLLKLAAWRDRHLETNRDAEDLAFIISNYLEINEVRAASENFDLYEADNFSTFIAGASLLGRDIKMVLNENPNILEEYIGILWTEIQKEEESRLINQIIETRKILNYESVYNSILSLINELNRTLS